LRPCSVRQNRPSEQKESALKHLAAALAQWRSYAATAGKQYKPQALEPGRVYDITGQIANVEADLELARSWQPGTVPDLNERPAGADTPFRP